MRNLAGEKLPEKHTVRPSEGTGRIKVIRLNERTPLSYIALAVTIISYLRQIE